jgi:hypothetical protein
MNVSMNIPAFYATGCLVSLYDRFIGIILNAGSQCEDFFHCKEFSFNPA